MKALNINELSTEQKIGQLIMACTDSYAMDRDYIHTMLREKRIGGIQIHESFPGGAKNEIDKIKKFTEYPVLIANDMEEGCPGGEYHIPSMLSLGITQNEELAYQFGAVTAIEAKRIGYNTAWGPQVDLIDGNAMFRIHRCLGQDPKFVGKMASAILRGYRDNGMISTAKHWPSPTDKRKDGHLFANISTFTRDDLNEKTFAPYRYAIESGMLSGIMTTHTVIPKSDPDFPTTLSERNVSIIRENGFDGIIMTDSLGMTGFLAKFGAPAKCAALAIKAGHDMVLIDRVSIKEVYENLLEAYRNGVFSEERLNDAVRHVIEAQNRTLKPATATEVSEYQKECISRIAREGISAIVRDGAQPSLNKATKKLFIVSVDNLYHNENGELVKNSSTIFDYDAFLRTKENILKKFPGSEVALINNLPSSDQIYSVTYRASLAEEVIFITNAISASYAASENLTEHVITTMNSIGNKISAVVHIGNPFALEQVPHVPRAIAIASKACVDESLDSALSILSGEAKPSGVLPIKINLR